MSDHSSSVFANSCLKLPRNPRSHQPFPVYEQKYIKKIQNEARRLSLDSNDMNPRPKSSGKANKDSVRSFIEFVDSIPEYDDVNHLSNREFYRRIEALKEKQKSYFEHVQLENKLSEKSSEWMDDFKTYMDDMKDSPEKENLDKKMKPTLKPFCGTPVSNKSPNSKFLKTPEDVESVSGTLSDKDLAGKPPSRRSVRIETPSDKFSDDNNSPSKLFRRPKSRSSKGQLEAWDDFSIDDYKLDLDPPSPMHSKSAPNSPSRYRPSVGWKDNGITIPKPFEMTVRDEENQIVEDLMAKTKKPSEEKSDLFKAHPIPIESQIPLFDKIMADQELKNQIVRERSKAMLQSQMRPFSFTKRDEEIQELTKRFSKSSPSLFRDDPPIKVKKFRAKPIPRNLFSNYVYKKMHEDEFYRALQKRIRAEEMLRAASLPPSMAKREMTQPKYDVCPKSYREALAVKENKNSKKPVNHFKLGYQDAMEKELEDLKNEFLAESPTSSRPKSKRGNRKSKKKKYRGSSASSSDSRTISSLHSDLRSVSRSNLAAVLRIESARKRLDSEMSNRLEEARLKEEARWREKLMRKKPIWETLAYSHEEDLAMRLQLRRDEDRLRNEEHRLRMQLMLGRVNQQPTLFERQSQIKYPKTKEELIEKLYPQCKPFPKTIKCNECDLGNVRSLVEMKDEAIQALLDDELKDLDSNNSKENNTEEEKEKCDSPSSEDNYD